MKYSNQEIDFFMTEKDDIFYLFPAPTPEKSLRNKTLRILPPKNGHNKNIDFAKDYYFEEVIKDY